MTRQAVGLLVVGHGSRRAEANAALRTAAESVAAGPPAAGPPAAEPPAAEPPAAEPPAAEAPWLAVGHAFLELSEPGIEDAYGQLVKAGCQTIVVSLFFLFPGAHTMSDIPAQLDRAAARHPGARWVITEPLGLHPAVLQAARARIDSVHPSA
ncbi:MAG: sirohydrochlorin chelatase [Frankiaceae bacterium]